MKRGTNYVIVFGDWQLSGLIGQGTQVGQVYKQWAGVLIDQIELKRTGTTTAIIHGFIHKKIAPIRPMNKQTNRPRRTDNNN